MKTYKDADVHRKQKLSKDLVKKIFQILKSVPKGEWITIKSLTSKILDVPEKDLGWQIWDGEYPILSTLNQLVARKKLEKLIPRQTKGFNCAIFKLRTPETDKAIKSIST